MVAVVLVFVAVVVVFVAVVVVFMAVVIVLREWLQLKIFLRSRMRRGGNNVK